MAPISANVFFYFFFFYFFFFAMLTEFFSATLSASVVDDLNSLRPPLDFNSTITNNCLNNPSHKYCTASPVDLDEIFKSTIVASHLCNESRNPNCVESFPKIDLRSRPRNAPLYLSFSFFWKYCPLSILSIDLANNSLKGGFPIDVLKCDQILALDLSQNDLSGYFPLESFSALTNLTMLNLSYNHFSESKISDAVFFNRFNSSSFLNSGIIPNHKNYKIKALLLLIGFPTFVILVTTSIFYLCFYRPDVLPRFLQIKHKFTPSMLRAATNGFSNKNLQAKSDNIDIFRGTLRDGTEIKIEIYFDYSSKEGRKKLMKECKILSQMSHPNLVQILGCCNTRRLTAIVAEWIEGESVDLWLLRSVPPWKKRLKVMKEVLEAISYLQAEWPQVGYDLRTRSILLSENSRPLISRFEVEDRITDTGVYKFGVFMLEMILKEQFREELANRKSKFIDYINLHYHANLLYVADQRMEMHENACNQVKYVIGLGLSCIDLRGSRQLNLSQISNAMKRIS